jgi:hypothetical protein
MKAENSHADMMQESASAAAKAATEASPALKVGGGPPCAAKVEKMLTIPANALLSQVEVSITAMPAGVCPLNEAGEIRISQDDTKQAIIDLKRMRSVSGLQAPQTISTINTWTGAEFGGSGASINKQTALFSEIATERLLVTFATDVKIQDLVDTGTIILPDAPADLVLSVNDKTAWTHMGPVKLAPADKQNASPSFNETIDITQLLQDAIHAGTTSIKIVLRTAMACRLQLTIPTPHYLLSHSVVFPAQALALEISEECRSVLSLPLPAASGSWQASSVFFTLEGTPGRSRIFPAVGPQALSLGELALDSEHALAASLTAASLSKFKNLEGVRLPLLVEEGGAEITAFLRQDDGGKVGEYRTDAAFQSQTIEPTQEEQWVLLQLSTAVDIQPETDLWLEINVIRGRCWWQLGSASGAPDGVVSLQRGIPGGSFSPFTLTLNGQAHDLQGRLRLKGQPVTDGAIHAIIPLDPQSEEELQGITTGTAPLKVELHFKNAVHPSNKKLEVPLHVHAPGTYTITDARVIYED